FWERVPYICIALVVFIIFWLLTKLFKLFIRKTLENRTYTRQNLVLVLNRVGSTFIIFFGFLIALVIAIPGFTPSQLIGALGIGSVAIGFAFKDIFQNLLSGILILLSEPFRIGDDIVVNGLEGNVEDIQI
ncbi:transporter, partial [Staphylococcus pseudintermedius]